MDAENKDQRQAADDKTSKAGGDVIVRDKSRQKRILFAAIGAALVLLAVIIIAVNALGNSDGKLQEQLDLGTKYLEEMDYEQALVAFNAALAIEPKNADAYLGIVEVYIRTNDFEAALKYAREGYEITGDERLKEKIDAIIQGQLDQGAKYLEEMDYEQALVAFNAVLAIEPENADAYLGIVEVYIRTSDFENALKYAREGYEVTGDERLKEKIDMLESGDISASNGWVMKMSGYDGEGNLVYWHELTYNRKGQQASVAKYNAQGEQEQYLELTYDEEGRRLIYYSFEVWSGNLNKFVKEYNGNGYRVTWYIGVSDEVAYYRDMETDSDGNILKETYHDAEGSVKWTAVCEYDEASNLIKSSSYDSNNELTVYWIYTYNEDGKKTKDSTYDSNNELINYLIYTYNEDGKLQQQQYYDSNNVLMSYVENVYDEEGNKIGERNYDADGVLQYERVFQ